MTSFAVDLHIHSALSPCAEEEMTPPNILARAASNGLRVIAITDHNTAANTPAFAEAARDTPLTVIPGMEVQTREEVHLICLFPTPEEALAWQEVVYRSLPPLKNEARVFGEQHLLNARGEVIGTEERLLLASTSLAIDEVFREVRKRGGICYPAHVDRPSYSIISNLGFIPPELEVTVAELSRNTTRGKALERFPFLARYLLIGCSDAHRLEEINRQRTRLKLAAPTFRELKELFTRGNPEESEVD